MERLQFKILVVDDEETLAEVLVESLELEAFQACFKSSADLANIHLESSDQYQLIICDANMPGMGGVDFLIHLKKRFANSCPFFFLYTGNVELSLDDFRKLGGDEIVAKPFDMDELVALIDVYRKRLGKP